MVQACTLRQAPGLQVPLNNFLCRLELGGGVLRCRNALQSFGCELVLCVPGRVAPAVVSRVREPLIVE